MGPDKNDTFNIQGDMNRVDVGAGATVGGIAVGNQINQTINQVFTTPSTPKVPESGLVLTYLEELSKQRPFSFWNDEKYVERSVSKSNDLFLRTVSRFDPGEGDKPESLDKVFERERRLILLGEPGIGKTTSLLHLAWHVATHTLSAAGKGEIPIYVELKYYNGEELETLLARQVNNVLKTQNLSLEGDTEESSRVMRVWLVQPSVQFILLFDGLNELPPEFHLSVRGKLDSMLNFSHRILISCREKDYDASLSNHAVAFVMQGLREEEINSYLRTMLGERGAKIYATQIRWSEKMLTLAANPLMLWVICAIASNDTGTSLPKNRGKLFQKFTRLLPRLRMAEKFHPEISLDLVESALAKLAFEMQRQGRIGANLADVRSWQLTNTQSDLQKILRQAKDWRLLKSEGESGNSVEFLHQLFQEYFAALELDRISHLESFDAALEEYLSMDWWGETIQMLVGLSDQSPKMLNWMCDEVMQRKDARIALLVREC